MSPTPCRRERPTGRRGRGRAAWPGLRGGENGGGHEVAVPDAVPHGEAAEGGGEEPGGEGVAGSYRGDDVDVRRPDMGGTTVLGEGDGSSPALLDDHEPRLGQRVRDTGRAAQPPRGLRLVSAHEDEVGPASEVEQDPWTVGVRPEPFTEVDVEGDEWPPRPGLGELPQQVEAVAGERCRDPGQMQHPPRARRRRVHVRRRHHRGRRPGPVVRHLVRVGRPVPRRTEVHPRRTRRITPYGRHVHAVRPDRLDQVVAEAVVADAADPAGGVAGGGEGAGHVGLGAADGTLEGRYVGEAARPGGQEGDHGLAERDDVHDVVGVAGSRAGHDRRGSSVVRGRRRLR